ncbi:MAG: hypothetical protein ACOCQ1_04185, partial [Halanaerobiaceae bacterium]
KLGFLINNTSWDKSSYAPGIRIDLVFLDEEAVTSNSTFENQPNLENILFVFRSMIKQLFYSDVF